jgi:hypothetical protein
MSANARARGHHTSMKVPCAEQSADWGPRERDGVGGYGSAGGYCRSGARRAWAVAQTRAAVVAKVPSWIQALRVKKLSMSLM